MYKILAIIFLTFASISSLYAKVSFNFKVVDVIKADMKDKADNCRLCDCTTVREKTK